MLKQQSIEHKVPAVADVVNLAQAASQPVAPTQSALPSWALKLMSVPEKQVEITENARKEADENVENEMFHEEESAFEDIFHSRSQKSRVLPNRNKSKLVIEDRDLEMTDNKKDEDFIPMTQESDEDIFL